MNQAFFDYTLNYNWDMTPVDRSLDPDKMQKYLMQLPKPDCSFVQDLLNKTTYVPYLEFKSALLQSFELFKQAIRSEEFYLKLINGKIGSEHWLTALLWSQLKLLNLKQIISEETVIPVPSDGTKINIVIIDDAIYTGNNTLAKMDELTDRLSTSLQISVAEIEKHLKFHIVVPYVSRFGLNAISDFSNTCKTYSIHYPPSLTNLVDISKYYPNDIENTLYSKFRIEIAEMPAIYFDHKVAYSMSTFSDVYLYGHYANQTAYGSLFKVNPSREKIEQLALLYKNWCNK